MRPLSRLHTMRPIPLKHLSLALVVLAVLLHPQGRSGLRKTMVHPRTVLPFLPSPISRPLIRMFYSILDVLPKYIADVTPSRSADWSADCFRKSSARLQLHNSSGSPYGGGTLYITVNDAVDWTCIDVYIFSTPYRLEWDYYFRRGEKTYELAEWVNEAEVDYVKNHGVSIFHVLSPLKKTLEGVWGAFPLITNTQWGEDKNIEFLKKHMNAKFEVRPQPWVAPIRPEDIQSGDFLALSKIRGRWGTFHSLQKWVTGSYSGHAAVCLRDPDGKLYVAESGRANEKGEEIIAVVPWDEYWSFELNKDEANPHIALLPLHPNMRAKFDSSAAWEFAKSMEGKPYGFHNMLFSWIDTVQDNYPDGVDENVVACFLTIWRKVEPQSLDRMWNEALNKRLCTQGLELPEILIEAEKRGISFGKLLTIPERDEWDYSDGKSTSCVAFVLSIYKQAGLFGQLATHIQATEFTIKDAYTLQFFEDNPDHLPSWCNRADKLPYCQILGKYRMELPGYNTMQPYSHMNENCPSKPPKYVRPDKC